jgi:hypothetical protein
VRGFSIRALRPGDDLDGLLDDGLDPLYVVQAHQLHGPARDGARWRRTLVAVRGERVVGAVTAVRNRVHPHRYPLAVIVAREHRREGIATALVGAVRELRPEPMPLEVKLRPADPAAAALLARFGARAYQTCPGPCLDPTAAAVRDWCAAQPAPPGVEFGTLDTLPAPRRVDCWVQMYEWVHASWSPADLAVLRETAPTVLSDVDQAHSVVGWRDGVPAIVLWVFADLGGVTLLAGETAHRDEPDGIALTAATVARCLTGLAAAGIARVEFDGHDSDPHLAPVVASFPAHTSDPLHLVEF